MEVAAGIRAGQTNAEIAARLGVSQSTVGREIARARRSGLDVPPRQKAVLRDLDYTVDPKTGCWIWRHSKNVGGYGICNRTVNGEQFFLAHRLSYRVLVGPIPPGLTLDHVCRNPPCINPDSAHLEVVTRAENIRRGPVAVLDWEVVGEIKQLHTAGGVTLRKLAATYGVTPAQVGHIIAGRCWREEY
jgi:hypothetical protein